MSLQDRFSATDDTKIPGHQWSAMWRLKALYDSTSGSLGHNYSQADITTEFSLDAGEQSQLSTLATTYAGLSNTDKIAFADAMNAVVSLLETGRMTPIEAATALGL